MKKVSIFEGKNKFSELINNAANGEPQIITKNGKETAVVISFDDYKRMKIKERPLVEFLLDNPAHTYGLEIDLSRDQDSTYRDVDLFSEE
jgi:prevent-host-death family protein